MLNLCKNISLCDRMHHHILFNCLCFVYHLHCKFLMRIYFLYKIYFSKSPFSKNCNRYKVINSDFWCSFYINNWFIMLYNFRFTINIVIFILILWFLIFKTHLINLFIIYYYILILFTDFLFTSSVQRALWFETSITSSIYGLYFGSLSSIFKTRLLICGLILSSNKIADETLVFSPHLYSSNAYLPVSIS